MKSSLFLAFFLLVAVATGMAQGRYAVKFVCGTKPPSGVVAPGRYFTAINVHNTTREPIEIRKQFSIALPGEKPGPVSEFFPAKLGPGQSFEIDCVDIARHIKTEGFAKGFAVIESKVPLDIVAVYTTTGAGTTVQTFFLERVPPSR